MTEKELEQLLNSVKDTPELGGGFDESQLQQNWMKISDEPSHPVFLKCDPPLSCADR